MIWFTSDLHFGHKNILKYMPKTRKFNDIYEHDDYLIKYWNNKIAQTDTVYFLGDFSFHSPARTKEILNQLNGNIIFIRGNHDRGKIIKMLKNNGYRVEEMMSINLMENNFILCHYPLEDWSRKMYKSIHLHGHIHMKHEIRKIRKLTNRVNVCYDIDNKIYSITDILKIVENNNKFYKKILIWLNNLVSSFTWRV